MTTENTAPAEQVDTPVSDEALLNSLLDESVEIPDENVVEETPAEEDPIPEATDLAPQDDAETEEEETAEEEDPQDGEEEPEAKLEPPARWDAKGREIFEKLDPDAQEYFQAREKILQGEHTRRQQELAQAKLDIRAAKQSQDNELSELISRVSAQYESKYAQITDETILDALSSGQITAEQAQYLRQEKAKEEATLERLNIERQKREASRHEEFVQEQMLVLQAKSPELAEDAELRGKVAQYLISQDVEETELPYVDARQMSIAHKAMLWDNLQDTKSKAKPKATRTGKSVKSRPVQNGNLKDQRMAALRRQGTPDALKELLDMQLDEALGV